MKQIVLATTAAAVFALLAVGFGSLNAAPQPTTSVSDSHSPGAIRVVWTAVEMDLLARHNAARVAAGIPTLKATETLGRVADRRCRQTTLDFSHQGYTKVYDNFGVDYVYAGENLARGYTTVDSVFRGWTASPGHNANILKAKFRHVGIGRCKASDGRVYWAVNFSD